MTRILVIDDDEDLLPLMQLLLESEGYEAHTALNGQMGLRKAAEISPDLIILDLMMPGMDGYETCRQFRAVTDTPILMLTSRSDEASMVHGLDTGADAYMVKPFANSVLFARIKTLLRRSGPPRPIIPRYQDEHLSIDLGKGEILVNGERVKLTPTEGKLLAYLFRNTFRVVPHQELIREVWGEGNTSGKRLLKLYILYLRRKLEQDPDNPVYLKTAWGIGYRFHCLPHPEDDGEPLEQ